VYLVISDAHAGLKAAVAQPFTCSSWQRCRVHFMRNLHTAVSAKHAPGVTAAVKTIFAHTDPEEVAAQWDWVADTLADSFPKVAAMMGEAKADVLAFTAFPKAHWQTIWSNNPIERLNKEIKRRADVVEIFPNPAAFLRLATAVVIEAHDEWQVARFTSPMSPWTNYGWSLQRNRPLQHLPNNTKSLSVQRDSLIATREPTPDPKSTTPRDAIPTDFMKCGRGQPWMGSVHLLEGHFHYLSKTLRSPLDRSCGRLPHKTFDVVGHPWA
jgi:putative transposase